jgi:hypothetical protein
LMVTGWDAIKVESSGAILIQPSFTIYSV